MRRPDWWPETLWPGATEPVASPGPGPATRTAAGAERERPAGAGEGLEAGGEPWPSLLDFALEALGAGSGAIWRMEGDGWSVVAERSAEGWAQPERSPRPARGHPFTWSVREDLVLQVPAGRVGDDDRNGWTLLVPVGRSRRLLELWFPSAPGPSVREATPALRAHLEWLAGAADGTTDQGGPQGRTQG